MSNQNKPHVVVMISAGPPPRGAAGEDPGDAEPTPEEHIRDCLTRVESGHPSHVEWFTVSRVHDHLSNQEKSGKISSRGRALLAQIRPVLSKYGYHGTSPTTTTRRSK